MKHLYLWFCFCWVISVGFSQNDSIQADTTDLEILKNLKVSEKASALQENINQKTGISLRKPLSQRESPSILSVISSEEIQKNCYTQSKLIFPYNEHSCSFLWQI